MEQDRQQISLNRGAAGNADRQRRNVAQRTRGVTESAGAKPSLGLFAGEGEPLTRECSYRREKRAIKQALVK
jgi:hypothetical protein